MRFRRPLPAYFLLFVSLLGAFGFLDQYPALHFREIAITCVLVTFFWLALSTAMNSRWILYVFLPFIGLTSFVMLYAYVFTVRVNAPLLPSVLAERYYVFFLLGPIVYMLHLRGWMLADFQRVFLASMVLTVTSYAAYDIVAPGGSQLFSGQFFMVQLAQENNLLQRLGVSALFLILYLGRRLPRTTDVILLSVDSAIVGLCALVLAVTVPRGLLAGAVAALVCYALLSRPARAKLSVIVLPLYVAAAVLLLPVFEYAFNAAFGEDSSYLARTGEISIAWQTLQKYPLLGFGTDSVQSVSYLNTLGYIYPQDIGLLGVAFQFGLLGLTLYLVLSGWICFNMLKLSWISDGTAHPKQGAFLYALTTISLCFFVASLYQGFFIYSLGFPIGAFCWGLILAHKHDSARTPVKVPDDEHADIVPVASVSRSEVGP